MNPFAPYENAWRDHVRASFPGEDVEDENEERARRAEDAHDALELFDE